MAITIEDFTRMEQPARVKRIARCAHKTRSFPGSKLIALVSVLWCRARRLLMLLFKTCFVLAFVRHTIRCAGVWFNHEL